MLSQPVRPGLLLLCSGSTLSHGDRPNLCFLFKVLRLKSAVRKRSENSPRASQRNDPRGTLSHLFIPSLFMRAERGLTSVTNTGVYAKPATWASDG